jgi:hypothetical protein
MSDSVKFPPDLLQLPPFRQLAAALGNSQQGLLAWWLLFSHLHYLAQEGCPCGRVPEAEVAMFKKTLETLASEMGAELGRGEHEGLFDLFVSVKLLKADGPDWVCPRYQVLNAGDRFGKGLSSLGGNMKAFKQKQSRADAEAMQQSLNIHESKFVDEEGVTLDSDAVRRVTRLIIVCDNALYKPSRPPMSFTEGLIQSALKITRRHTDDEIDYVCEQVALHRNHPRLAGLTTERLLPQFGDMVRHLGQ